MCVYAKEHLPACGINTRTLVCMVVSFGELSSLQGTYATVYKGRSRLVDDIIMISPACRTLLYHYYGGQVMYVSHS